MSSSHIIRPITDNGITRLLWMGVALTVPIFGVSFGHLDVGFFHFAPPIFFMLAIFYIAVIICFIRGGIHYTQLFPKSYKTLMLLLSLFVVLHLVSLIHSILIQSEWIETFGIKNVVKILSGFLFFWFTIAFFPRDKKFIEQFFIVVTISLSFLLAVFIYRYAVVFKLPFMSTDYTLSGRSGKNQIAVQAAFFFFYALCPFLFSKKKWIFCFPLLIISISIVYLESRMGWAAALLGIVSVVYYVWQKNPVHAIKLASKIILVLFVIVCSGIVVLSRYTDLWELSVRFVSIYNPSAISTEHAKIGKNSYQLRGSVIKQAFDGFVQSPLIGVGVGNTLDYVGLITHNDYSTILLEMGLSGEILFLLILYTVWRRAKSPRSDKQCKIEWLLLSARAGFIVLIVCLNFFNFYLSPYFWFYLALYVVTVETVDPLQNGDRKRLNEALGH